MFAKSRQSSQGQESNIIHGMHEIVFYFIFKINLFSCNLVCEV